MRVVYIGLEVCDYEGIKKLLREYDAVLTEENGPSGNKSSIYTRTKEVQDEIFGKVKNYNPHLLKPDSLPCEKGLFGMLWQPPEVLKKAGLDFEIDYVGGVLLRRKLTAS